MSDEVVFEVIVVSASAAATCELINCRALLADRVVLDACE